MSSAPINFEAEDTGFTALSGSNQLYFPACSSGWVIVSRNLLIKAVIPFSAVNDFNSISFSVN